MPTLKSIRGFAGLNTQSPENLIDDNELQECTNFMVGLKGELKKRPGLERLNNSTFTAPINLLGVFTNPATGVQRIFAGQEATNTTRYSENGTAWTAFGTAVNNIVWATTLGSRLYFGTDAAGVYEYNWGANTLTALTSSPNGKEGIVFKQRMFVVLAGATPLFPGRIQFSEPFGAAAPAGGFTGAAAWPSTNTIDVEGEFDGDFIVALFPINDSLYVFKRNSIWAVYIQGSSPADWIVRKVVSNLGCVYKKGVAQFNNVVYFRSQNGIYRTDGTTFQEISGQIRDEIKLPQGHFTSQPVNRGAMMPMRYKEYIIFPTYDSPNNDRTIWCYNFKTQAWSKWSPNIPVDAITTGVEVVQGSTNLRPGIYFGFGGVATANKIVLAIREGAEVTLDDSANTFTASMRTKDFDFNNLDQFKRIDWIGADVYSQNTDLEYRADGSVGFNDASVVVSDFRRFVKTSGPGSCRRISVWVGDNADSFQSRIHSVVIEGSIESETSRTSTL